MAAITYTTFLGQMPLLDPTDLPDANGQVALDCWFLNGTLTPIRNSTTVGPAYSGAPTRTQFRYRPCPYDTSKAFWVEQVQEWDVCNSPIANDKYGRLFMASRDGQSLPFFADVKGILGTSSDTELCSLGTPTTPFPKTLWSLGLPSPGTPTAAVTDNWSSLATSTDGNTWTGPTTGNITGMSFKVVAHAGSVWLAGGPNGRIIYSSDGLSWSIATLPDSAANVVVRCFASGNGYLVAGCSGGTLLYSTNSGAGWTAVDTTKLQMKEDINVVLYATLNSKNVFIVAGNNGEVYRTAITGTLGDPTGTWTRIKEDTTTGANGTGFGTKSILCGGVTLAGRVLLAGAGGTIKYLNASQAVTAAWNSATSGFTDDIISMSIAADNLVGGNKAVSIATATAFATSYVASTSTDEGRLYTAVIKVANNNSLSAVLNGQAITAIAHGNTGQRIIVAGQGKVAVEQRFFLSDEYAAPAAGSFGKAAINSVFYYSGRYVTVGETSSGTADTRYYVVTFVDHYGSESPPSDPSGSVVVESGQTVRVDIPAMSFVVPDDNNAASNRSLLVNTTGAKYRIYRTSTSGSGTNFLFVAEVDYSASSVSYSDVVLSENLAEVLPSSDWARPPQYLKGMVASPGGVLAGFTTNALWFSEPGQPHAWPTKYMRTVDYPIVGLAVFGNSILVATTGQPYLVSGIDPFNMAVTKLEAAFSCISRNSIVDLGGKVAYASPLGLVTVSTNGVEWVTREIMSRSQWQQLSPSTMRATSWEGKYLAFFDGSGDYIPTGAHSMAITPGGEADGVSFFTETGYAPIYDLIEQQVYYLDGTGNRKSWNTASTYKTALWRSKRVQSPNYVNFGFLQIQPETYPVTVRLISEEGEMYIFEATFSSYDVVTMQSSYTLKTYNSSGTLTGTYNGTCLNDTIRLPPGRRSRFHTIEIQTSTLCRQALLAQSSQEVAAA